MFSIVSLLSVIQFAWGSRKWPLSIMPLVSHRPHGTPPPPPKSLPQACWNLLPCSSGSSGGVRGAGKHEIYVGAFSGHLFYDLFSQGRGGHGPLGPPRIRYCLENNSPLSPSQTCSNWITMQPRHEAVGFRLKCLLVMIYFPYRMAHKKRTYNLHNALKQALFPRVYT